jgi:OOP family OmpA-OmpF porin
LSSAGFGMERPIETNSTEEGRHANRRVEFHIVEINGKPATEEDQKKEEQQAAPAQEESSPDSAAKPSEDPSPELGL